jgi:crotonobetainyl-CoA:carnitine CoA-transferase CaiB-like acyl-CoA transferase
LSVRIATVLGARADLVADDRFRTNDLRVGHRADLIAELDATLATDSAVSRAKRLQAAGIACGPVNDSPTPSRSQPI